MFAPAGPQGGGFPNPAMFGFNPHRQPIDPRIMLLHSLLQPHGELPGPPGVGPPGDQSQPGIQPGDLSHFGTPGIHWFGPGGSGVAYPGMQPSPITPGPPGIPTQGEHVPGPHGNFLELLQNAGVSGRLGGGQLQHVADVHRIASHLAQHISDIRSAGSRPMRRLHRQESASSRQAHARRNAAMDAHTGRVGDY